MREIKFRIWLPGIKKMTYPHTIEELMNWGTKDWTNGTAEFLQYTGLKDKNGKGREIYEADVYRQDSRYYIIEWNDTQCGFVAKSLTSGKVLPGFLQGEIAAYDDYEYVGSIHEHPELLKGEEQA